MHPSGLESESGGCARFPEILQNFRAPDFVENVLGSFSCLNIEIAYSNFTSCDALTLSFFAFRWKLSKFQENEHPPSTAM